MTRLAISGQVWVMLRRAGSTWTSSSAIWPVRRNVVDVVCDRVKYPMDLMAQAHGDLVGHKVASSVYRLEWLGSGSRVFVFTTLIEAELADKIRHTRED